MSSLKEKIYSLTNGDIKETIVNFMVPVLIGQLLNQIYHIADAVIVGQALGMQELASVVSAAPLLFLATGLSLVLASVTEELITECFNRKDKDGVPDAVHTSVLISLIIAVIVSVAGYFLAEGMLKLMRTPFDILTDAVRYLRICFAGYWAMLLYQVLKGVIHAGSDTKGPLYYLMASVALNIVLDLVFVMVLRMGVSGAAYATVISQILSMILVLKDVLKEKGPTGLRLSSLRISKPAAKEISRMLGPALLQDFAFDFPAVLIQIFINDFGSAAIAGIGAAVRTEEFIFLFTDVFAMSGAAFLSQNIAAGEYKRAKKAMSFLFVTAVLFIEIAGILTFLFAPSIIRMYCPHIDVVHFGSDRLRVVSLFYFLVGFCHVSSAIMRATGRERQSMLVMVFCWFLARILLLACLGNVLHVIELAYWIYPMTWSLSAGFYAYFMLKTRIRKPRTAKK